MRAHTAGQAKGRYICPIDGGVVTLGLAYTVQLTEAKRLEFVPGWDDDQREPDPDRPGWLRPVRYHRAEPTDREQERLARAGGRVFGPGCVIGRDFTPYEPSDRYHGKAGVFLVPAPDADPATWFVNEPVTYKKCAACPKRIVASDTTRVDRDWVPARATYWRGGREVEVSPGPHPAGSYACPDCRPPEAALAQAAGQATTTAPDTPENEEAAAPSDAVVQPESDSSGAAGGQHGDGGGYAPIHAAMARLAGVCDFAETLDGQGFNATDTWLGHVLAAMPVDDWAEDEALTAWDMLRKYRGQLGGFGIGYDDLPRPPGADELEAARRAEARERARQGARRWREQQYRKTHSYVRCDGVGEKVALAFPYDPDAVSQAKAIKGRSFDWETKGNVYPFASLPQVVALADARGIEVAPEVRALVPAAVELVEQEAARPDVYLDRSGRIVISAVFNPALNDALKKLNGGRSTWDQRARVHRPPVHRDPGRVLAIAEEFSLSVSEEARAAIETEQAQQESTRAAATAFEAEPLPIPGLADGLSLKPQQYPVVAFAREHRRVLIGDDMGWGKTLSSLAAVAADGAYPAVVVCRPSLTLNWVAEIRRFFPALSVYEASGTTPQPVPGGTDVIVIGSAALAAKPHKTEAGGKEFGWVKALEAVEPKALIIDEGQDTKERGANRSQACEQLAGSVRVRDGLVLNLTGTAILNRPRELCQQLTILGLIGEFGGPKAFLWRYCLSETSQWGASYNGARNLIELHDRLLRWGIMIRRADDAKLGLPPCREHVLRIPDGQLDPAVMARYRKAEADLLAFLADQARQAAERLGEDPASAAVQATIRAQAAEHLVAINTLRQLAGQAKRGYVTGWIGERVAAGEKVMVAAHHRDEVDAYAAAFGGLKLQGGQTVADKEAAKAAFQQQPPDQAPVISVAIGAGGVGHTLTAAAIGIQTEQAWTPGETQQMKKRLHRIGQDRPVDYYITVAENTIDEHLWAVVTTKQATLDAVLDGKTDNGIADDEKSVAAELAWRLTQQGLGISPESAASQANPPGSHEPGSEFGQDRREDVSGGEPRPAGAQTASKAVSRRQPEDEEDQVGAGEPGTVSSVLDDATLARMRTEAAAGASPFVDPALLREADALLPAADRRWLERVIGHPVPSHRTLTHTELLLAVGAAKADTAHLRALAGSQRAAAEHARQQQAETAAAAARAEQDKWQALHSRLPVPVTVQHNWTARHLDGYEQGADHIVVLEDLHAGRMHRTAGSPLCWTPSRAHELRHVSGNVDDGNRLPDCKACLNHAEKLASAGSAPAVADSPHPAVAGSAGGMPADSDPAAVHTERGLDRHQESPRENHGQPPQTTRATQETTPSDAGSRSPEQADTCAFCRDAPAGPGGILCPACRVGIESRNTAKKPDEDSDDGPVPAPPSQRAEELRECAHRYLEDGLSPVPAWVARPDGGCCCPRGVDCPRPGKHPRSVHTGPGAHDYSWKPLACRTHAEVDERFAAGGPYAAGNLMVAIPPGMMAIDRDDDDGGEAALAALKKDLGELPPTLSHPTPHGQHLIYRTPPGWTGRAWVGKDPANPVPAGVDLRMPGQILMAPPSIVPGPGGPASYGPTTGDHVAPLPAAYLAAWTPPQPKPWPASRPVPVPPDGADRAVKYVHDAMTGIITDLASHQPGGRNTATYQAGLKAGSLLGAARATPGAEQAAAAWTDEAAEDALMDAAERNGYIGKDGQAEARRAIRSGLRNGLRNPRRALPDFTTMRPSPRTAGQDRSAQRAQPQPTTAVTATSRARRWQDMVPADARNQIDTADQAARDRLRAAQNTYREALTRCTRSGGSPEADVDVQHAKAEADAAYQEYTQDGRHITGRHDAAMLRWAASITTQPQPPAAGPAISPEDSPRMQANRAALAASEAYRAGDFDQAQRLTDQAASLDPSRAELWQQHRKEIAARQLVLAARAAYTEGDQQRAEKLLADARQLDPRMRAIWNTNLSAPPATHRGGQPSPASPGPRNPVRVRPAADARPQHHRLAASAQPDAGTPQPAQPPASPGSPAPSAQTIDRGPGPRWPDQPALGSPPSKGPAAASASPASAVQPESDSRWQRIHAQDVKPGMVVRNPYGGSRGRGIVASEARQMPGETVEFDVEDGRTGRFRRHFELGYDHHATRQLAVERADPQASTETQRSITREPAAKHSATADWRDQVIATAREPWQPGPIQLFSSALLRSPDANTPPPEIETDR
jgi:superfamily II DNA or RNA helicase/tetratricopeptide (TPR) repeat protein